MMAAGALSEPGTEYGACVVDCEHPGCVMDRRMAATPCVHCSEPIGYARDFFNVTPDDAPVWTVLSHAGCEWDALARDEAR